ncbi:MAG: DNA-directed RNA polymerase subunit omega, partial [Clostridia bacterium]|nr:DNA-directed RNA polymerase subunit omega [Clostridia bacterium]
CCVVAKRAKELAVNPAEEMESKKPITFAAEEFDQGATVIKK